MTGEPDLYAVLGVRPDATPAEISHAYRMLVRRHHPDSSAEPPSAAGSSDELERIVAAYAVLRDAARRAEYDQRHRKISQRRRTPRTEVRIRRGAEPPEPPRTEPPIRFGPVRYHGPSRGADR